MLWFFATILIMSLLIAASHAAGWTILSSAPWRIRTQARASLAVATGLACMILILVPAGWFGSGFSHPVSRFLGGVLLLVPSWLAWKRSGLSWVRSCLGAILLSIACTLPFTLQLLRFGAFDALNDPWTYMVQSQWLQHHGLIEKLHPDNSTGVLTQVYFTQITQTRAAAQFALGFIQGVFGLPWAHQAYPAAIALFYAAGALAVTYPLRLRRATPRWLAPVFALVFATTLNGFTFGTMRGYLPQTAGLSLALAAILLSASLMASRSRLSLGAIMTGGMLLASAVFTYSEILPFLVLAAGSIVLGCLIVGWSERGMILGRTSGLLAAFVLLTNIELWRATKAIIGQAKAVVGEGIPWDITAFVAHAAGARAGYADGNLWWSSSHYGALILACIVIGLALLAFRGTWRERALLLPLFALLGASTILFVYYRFMAANPFVVGAGQSWSQFKLANWSSIFLFALAGSGLGVLSKRWRSGLLVVCCVIVTVGTVQAWQLADLRTARLRGEVGSNQDPFETLTAMAKEIQATTTPPVFLDFPADRAKSRQLLAYLLPAGSIIADWSDDVFVSWMLSTTERKAARLSAGWRVTHASESSPPHPRARLGNYILSEQQHIELPLPQVSGGYPTEISAEGRLNWVKDSISYAYVLPAGLKPPSFNLEAEIIAIVPGLEFTVTSSQGTASHQETIRMPESHQAWSRAAKLNLSMPLAPNSDQLLLEFTTATPSGIIGGNDKRELTFLIRNLRVWLDRPASSPILP